MTHDELVERLGSPEWRDVEFKAARRAVPRNAWETVSAFANTEGGHLVFGVQERGGGVEVVGVRNVDKVQSDFLSTLRQRDKISTLIPVEEHLFQHDGATVLVFRIPEAHRSEKPVFLDGDIRRAFVRSGGSDLRLSNRERDRFLVDAATDRYDSQSVDLDPSRALDGESVHWYRAAYETRPGNRSYRALDDLDFLGVMGLLRDEQGAPRLKRAAILLFGSDRAFAQTLPRAVVDCQRFARPREQARNGERWFDRLVIEDNLVRTWRALLDTWYPRIAEHPFRVDPATLQREDTPPDFLAVREALVNLLMHQDYAEHGRSAEILHDPLQTVFRNPGDAFAPISDLMEPGEKEARNPQIVRAFRRIGLSENAGWGLRDVFENWREVGLAPPWIRNSRRRKRFELVLPREALSDARSRLERRLGDVSEHEAGILSLALEQGEVSASQVRAATGLSSREAVALAEKLADRALLAGAGAGRFRASRRLRKEIAMRPEGSGDQVEKPSTRLGHSATDQVGTRDRGLGHSSDQVEKPSARLGHSATDQVGAGDGGLGHSGDQVEELEAQLGHSTGKAVSLTRAQKIVVDICHEPRSLKDLLARAGASHRTHFRLAHIGPLLDAGILRMTNPEKPRAANQRYVLTEVGHVLRAQRIARGGDG